MLNKFNPKITVIVPVYNSEKYLDKCIKSLICQTYENLEIICINDGSTDNSLEILEKYKLKDERIILLSQENSGVSTARNNGIKAATGDYVSFIDADDWVLLTLYQTFADYVSKAPEPVDIWCFNAAQYAEGKSDIIPNTFLLLSDWNNHKDVCSIHTFDDCMQPFSRNLSAANKIYRREFLLKNKLLFPENLKFEDSVFSMITFLNAKSIMLTEEIFYRYRNNNGITASSEVTPKVLDIFNVVDLIEKEIRRLNLYNDYKYALFQYKYRVFVRVYNLCPENLKDYYYNLMKNCLTAAETSSGMDWHIYTGLKNYEIYEFIRNHDRKSFDLEIKYKYRF